jgi:hypothetical protein
MDKRLINGKTSSLKYAGWAEEAPAALPRQVRGHCPGVV